MTANVYANEADALERSRPAAAVSTADDRANELIEGYLARNAGDRDYLGQQAYKLGTAIAMLGSLLELYEGASPEITRRLFERWRAEQSGDVKAALDMQAEGGAP